MNLSLRYERFKKERYFRISFDGDFGLSNDECDCGTRGESVEIKISFDW